MNSLPSLGSGYQGRAPKGGTRETRWESLGDGYEARMHAPDMAVGTPADAIGKRRGSIPNRNCEARSATRCSGGAAFSMPASIATVRPVANRLPIRLALVLKT